MNKTEVELPDAEVLQDDIDLPMSGYANKNINIQEGEWSCSKIHITQNDVFILNNDFQTDNTQLSVLCKEVEGKLEEGRQPTTTNSNENGIELGSNNTDKNEIEHGSNVSVSLAVTLNETSPSNQSNREGYKSILDTVEGDEKETSTDIPLDIPSPFKKKLFWPEIPKPSKRKIEKTPSVATSKEWQEYFRKKETKKLEKEQDIENRKRKRQENKEQKENKITKKTQKQEEILKEKNEEAQKNIGLEKNTEIKNDSWFCIICEEDCQESMIECQQCLKWMHDRCANVSKQTTVFVCQLCNVNI